MSHPVTPQLRTVELNGAVPWNMGKANDGKNGHRSNRATTVWLGLYRFVRQPLLLKHFPQPPQSRLQNQLSPNFLNPPYSPPPDGWAFTPPILEGRIPSSKGGHTFAPGSTKRHTLCSPPKPSPLMAIEQNNPVFTTCPRTSGNGGSIRNRPSFGCERLLHRRWKVEREGGREGAGRTTGMRRGVTSGPSVDPPVRHHSASPRNPC